MEEVWKVLDNKYAQEEEIVNSANANPIVFAWWCA